MKATAASYLKSKAQAQGIEIRPYRVNDFRACQQTVQLRGVARNRFDQPHPIAELSTKEQFREFVHKTRAHGKLRVHFIYGIFKVKTGVYIGQVDLMTINPQLSWANLGYYIFNQFAGHGHATLAAKLALIIAFDQLGFHRVEAAMELDHQASQKVAKKNSMVSEGIRRKFFAHEGGVDFKVYALNAIDYKKLRRKK